MKTPKTVGRRPIVQVGDNNTLHVHVRERPNRYAFCDTRRVAGSKSTRSDSLVVVYCRKHKQAAEELWIFFESQRGERHP